MEESIYNSIVQGRLTNADDFVVDDDGQGYMETGLEIWDQPYDAMYSSNDEDDIDPMILEESKRSSAIRKLEKQKRLRLQTLNKNPLEKAFATSSISRTSSFPAQSLPEANVCSFIYVTI